MAGLVAETQRFLPVKRSHKVNAATPRVLPHDPVTGAPTSIMAGALGAVRSTKRWKPVGRSTGPIHRKGRGFGALVLPRTSAGRYFLAFFLRALRHHLADLVYCEHATADPLAVGPTSLAAASTMSRGEL